MPNHLSHFTARRPALLLASLVVVLAGSIADLRAEKITIALSQEQDGGSAGRACIYVHQGKAEYRIVKAGQTCAAEITVVKHQS